MTAVRRLIRRYIRGRDGAVTVEGALISGIMVLVTAAGLEAAVAYWQWNNVQQAARVGARIAATSDPVARSLRTMTGLSNQTDPGDPMPDYAMTCYGASGYCYGSSYDSTAMRRIFYGPDNDGKCGVTSRERRGLCDMADKVQLKNIQVRYENSGLGTAGNPASPVPLITVTVTGLSFDFVFLDKLTRGRLTTMPDVKVAVLSEDLKTGV